MDIALKMALCDFKGSYLDCMSKQSSTQHSLKCSLCLTKTSKMKAIHKINISATATDQILQDMISMFFYEWKQKNVYCLLDVRLFKITRQSNAWLDTPSYFHVKVSKYCIIKQCKISPKCMFALLSKTWCIEKEKNRLGPLLTHIKIHICWKRKLCVLQFIE